MSISAKLDQLHAKAKQNRWLWYFSIFNRIGLAAGFIGAGIVKIMGERFTSLSNNHPMGQYLEALYHTGYYYPFIGVLQVIAAILLLIPRTVVLGALLYFPIILNICILSLSVRFEGSLITSPLMVLGNLYLLCWNYDKLKFILPFKQSVYVDPPKRVLNNKFPWLFFGGVVATVAIVVLTLTNIYDIMPRNTLNDCLTQSKKSENPKATCDFCDCIHKQGKPLEKCLEAYKKAKK